MSDLRTRLGGAGGACGDARYSRSTCARADAPVHPNPGTASIALAVYIYTYMCIYVYIYVHVYAERKRESMGVLGHQLPRRHFESSEHLSMLLLIHRARPADRTFLIT